jgi:hypothetical protein
MGPSLGTVRLIGARRIDMLKVQVITVGASHEAQVSLLTRLGTHGGIEVLDRDSREMSDVGVILVGPQWAGASPELAHLVATPCRLARQGNVPLCVVRERGDWYEHMHESDTPLAKDLYWFVAAPLDSPRLAERIVEAGGGKSTTKAPDFAALRAAAVGLRKAADELAALCRGLERAPTPSIEAHSDRLAAIRNIEAMLRVQATIADDDAAHRRIELSIAKLGDKVEMPAHVTEDVDRTIREAIAQEGK